MVEFSWAPTYWQRVLHGDRSLPDDRPLDELTAELVEMLGHPSSRLREDIAYPILTAWLDAGVYDDFLSGLGDGLVPGLQREGDQAVRRPRRPR